MHVFNESLSIVVINGIGGVAASLILQGLPQACDLVAPIPGS